MFTLNMSYAGPDLFEGKTGAVRELYDLLLSELNKIGPVRETKKELSINLENRKAFASAWIRSRSIKLIVRTNHKISSPRIRYIEHVTGKSYDHTIFLESKNEIDQELLKWLGEAYQAGK